MKAEYMEEGQLDDTTTVAIRKFYKKFDSEKPMKEEEKLTLEETHDIINLNWFPYEPRESI